MVEISIVPENTSFPDSASSAAPDATALHPVVACYENQVPAFVEADLERLYGNIYSTIGMFRFDGSLASACTYVVRSGGVVTTLLLYRRENSVVTVLNGSITLTQAEIDQFARTMFMQYRTVSAIAFNAICTEGERFAYPYQQHHYGEDIVVTLPATSAEYLASLGKNMRETVKRYMNRLKRTYHSFRFEVYVRQEASEEQIRELFRLHRARIENKNDVSHVTDAEIDGIVAHVKTNGLVTIATIDGKVCGGMVLLRAGDNYFMRAIAHDPQYDDAKLGTLSCYMTICECIARGGKAFHFSPGRLIYKYRFNGVEKYYTRLVLYRSHLHVALNGRYAARNAIRGNIREAKLWLMDAELRSDPKSRAAIKGLRTWRAFKGGKGITEKIAAARTAWQTFDAEPAKIASNTTASAEASQELLVRRHALAEPAGAGKTGAQPESQPAAQPTVQPAARPISQPDPQPVSQEAS